MNFFFLYEVGQKTTYRDKNNPNKTERIYMNVFMNLKKMYPDLLEGMRQRYLVLYRIQLLEPIGRRGLVDNTGFPERHVRNEVERLQEQGLIELTTKGMYMTKEGKLVIDELHDFIKEISGLTSLENQLTEKLQVKQVIVVPGDSDEFDWVKQEMGKAAVSYLKSYIQSDKTIAVTGGTTMAAAAEVMTPLGNNNACLFVPARGGIGEKVENQANTIAAKMAEKEKGDYRLLFIPDPLSETSYQTMKNEPSINDTVQLIKDAEIVIHGVGDALTMARRRKTAEAVLERLEKEQAVSEAFGYYFDESGKVVYKSRTIGMQLEDLSDAELVMTIAGGSSKAQAISSYMKQKKSNLLITDQAAAEQIMKN
ncbi:sugar-binding transcriptional regulator [Virgibacillus sp. W0181]|uniref:sugar-binding transcriptional regulator n=1 Tax=Virgibacillus sp. W0181 TaxID=3391581 RepID=UPI003F4833D9